MDAERRGEVTDATLDRELQAVLGVDPSPEFVARVRTRIANEPSLAATWLGAWTIFGSAVAVAAIVLIAVVVSRDTRRNAPSPPPVLDSRSATLSAWTAPDLKGRSLAGFDRRAPSRGGPETAGLHQPARPRSAEAAVLVDPREAAALRALIVGTRDGRIDLTPMVNASAPSVMELPPVVDIQIPAITIDPIGPGTGEEGVRQ
jgi:hypothetical protein